MKITFLKSLKESKNNINKPYFHKIDNEHCNQVHYTEYDHFPYTKFYKGEILSTKPKIDKRVAGYSKVNKPSLPFIRSPLTDIKRVNVVETKEDYVHSNFIQSNDIWLYR